MGQHLENTMISLKPFSEISYIPKWTKWAAGRLFLLRDKHLYFLEVTGVEVAGRCLPALPAVGVFVGSCHRLKRAALQHSPGCSEKPALSAPSRSAHHEKSGSGFRKSGRTIPRKRNQALKEGGRTCAGASRATLLLSALTPKRVTVPPLPQALQDHSPFPSSKSCSNATFPWTS